MTVEQRLELLMSNEGINQKQIAEAVSVSGQTITNWKIRNSIGKASARTLSDLYGYSLEWLLTGNGPMRNDGRQPAAPAVTTPSNVYRVEVLNLSVSAGPGTVNSEFVEVLRSVEYSPEDARMMFDGRKQEQVRIINVRGDSMSGTIEPGDLLFVDISVNNFDGDGIYAFLYDDTAHVKRLQKMKDKLLVISDNKSYTPWDPIERDEMNRVFVFGKVIGSMPQTYRKHG